MARLLRIRIALRPFAIIGRPVLLVEHVKVWIGSQHIPFVGHRGIKRNPEATRTADVAACRNEGIDRQHVFLMQIERPTAGLYFQV